MACQLLHVRTQPATVLCRLQSCPATRKMLDDATVAHDPATWAAPANAPQRARLARLYGAALRAAAMAARLAPSAQSRALRQEDLAKLYHDVIAPYHPMYDSLAAVRLEDCRRGTAQQDAVAEYSPLDMLSGAREAPVEADGLGCEQGEEQGEQLDAGGSSGESTGLWVSRARQLALSDWRYRAACHVAARLWSAAAQEFTGERLP